MENIKELRNELVEIFTKLKNKQITPKEAKELVNTAGKIIASIKTQIDYHKMNGNKASINFMKTDEDIKEEPKKDK